MIEINNNVFNNYNYEITWERFSVSLHGTKRKGIAPFITFNIENNIFIGIEFVLSKEMVENIKLNVNTNVNEYISDIIFNNGKGWMSLTTGNYSCYITRIDKNSFNLNLFVDYTEIKVNMNVTIKML